LIHFRGWNGTREQGGTRERERTTILSLEIMKFNDGTKYIDRLSFVCLNEFIVSQKCYVVLAVNSAGPWKSGEVVARPHWGTMHNNSTLNSG